MKTSLPVLLLAAAAAPLLAVPPEITNVRAEQRADTKLVDVWYDAADADGDLLKIRIEVSDNDGVRYSVPAFSLTGDIGEGIAPGAGKHIVWDAGVDWDGEYSDKMRIKVFAVDAKGYPGLEWGDEVPPGGFLLGQDGGVEGSGPSRHVNIPWSYWLSKYEITVGQYCDFLNTALVAGRVRRDGQTAVYSITGTNLIDRMDGEYLLCDLGDSYRIRWNVNNFEVVGNYTNYPASVTWYGAMAWANFYGYDLPTEAEWEKAARGPDFDDEDEHCLYTWGDDKTSSKASFNAGGFRVNNNNSYSSYFGGEKPIGYYNGNQTPIGPDMVNGYGCYDMTGNADEWTRSLAIDQREGNSVSFDIDDYPQQEDLESPRNQYWNHRWATLKTVQRFSSYPARFVLKHGEPIYVRFYGSYYDTDNYQRIGFRVCRRYIPDEQGSGD